MLIVDDLPVPSNHSWTGSHTHEWWANTLDHSRQTLVNSRPHTISDELLVRLTVLLRISTVRLSAECVV
ncbi:unnamed protein product [Oppiella nova]|uniref:Uncharacterized protein n=1 Tax=Oppiella nova TaxID=334625 RepID=A0A7R9MS07_9ACAR|nr:unnamed protein product [Oppiella nova]CAG2181966.1 unnamed protein product [Oppiella nova]